jgi:hypothetical protein
LRKSRPLTHWVSVGGSSYILSLYINSVKEVVYYESRKRELKIRLMNEGRYDERLKVRVEESTFLTYTGLHDKTN